MQSPKPRFDGWTPARQLVFLDVLARTRSVSAAARSVGMSREGAYRLRRRPEAALFRAAWDRAMDRGVTFARGKVDKGHRSLVRRPLGAEGGDPRPQRPHSQLRDFVKPVEPSRISLIHKP